MESISFNIKVPLLEKAATNVMDIISHIRLNDGVYFDRSKYNKDEIMDDLRSSNDQKKVEAVKRLLIAHAMKEDVSEFYVEVSNNLSNKDPTLKKLIYHYLSLYADRNGDLTMLTVNSFKKDIISMDFQIRAYALRAMCSCRSLEMISVVMDSLKIMAKDRSPYVRKTAADVIPSIYNVDPDQLVFLRNILLDLIGDREVTVVSAAVASFCTMYLEVLPQGGETIHGGLADEPGGEITKENPDEEAPRNGSTDEMASTKGGNTNGGNTNRGNTPNGIHRENLHNLLSFLHPHYYKLCRYLLMMHPFHQTYLIDLLLRYCRVFYRDPLTNENMNFKQLLSLFRCSDGGETEEGANEAEEQSPFPQVISEAGQKWDSRPGEDSSPSVECIPRNGAGTSHRRRSPSPYHSYYSTDEEWSDDQEEDHPHQHSQRYRVDIELYIEKLLLLLSSCSYNVVIQSISALYHLTKFTFKENIIQAIISSIMRSSIEGNDHTYVLFIRSVQSIVIHLRQDFAPYLSLFYISALDSIVKKSIKIDLLYILSNEENRTIVLEELLHALFQPGNDDPLVKKLFRHITAVAVVDSSCLSTVMQHIISLLNCSLQLYSYEAILSLRQLLRQSDSQRIAEINFFLTRIFFTIESTEVQVSVLWTLAKYQNFSDHLLLYDFARMLVKRFEDMEGALKVQVLHFFMKVWAYQYARWFLQGAEAGEGRSGAETGEKRAWERPATTTSIYQEQHSKIANGTNNHAGKAVDVANVAHHMERHEAYHLEDFSKYERLCRLALLQGSRPEERFDIQETSKFYANIMLRIRQLADKCDLNWTFWQRDLYKEAVSEYTLSLCYLKHVILSTGNGDPSAVLRLSMEEMQHVRNSPVGTAQGEEHNDYGEYHLDLDHHSSGSGNNGCVYGDVQIDLKNPVVLQLNTMSSILNRRLPSYVELPDFAEDDLPRSAHMTNRKKTKQPVTSISSRDVKISYSAQLSNDQIFSDVDDFYREEGGNLVERHTGCTQKTPRNAHKPMLQSRSGLLTNRGTKIQGEDDESDESNKSDQSDQFDEEQNEASPKVGYSADTYLGECTSPTNFSKIDEQQINDIEKFFFSDEEYFEREPNEKSTQLREQTEGDSFT
ncbi:hypothetical protein C922_00850 [Plasmodium inui San Antonio 1]|uniref:Clathrin/coatomer adaptor adaptin-like N-terminal domain-containing protein n=1 Tax=Plasmodium inui San Antonio 1 TaxID=1237626 RepID=W7AHE4_9APIC|nr:hypothetical protein C922_00850 [Plasmodium inui San Antonio 1]EUD68454.1 hypothetical protein C922_00850 [Plasmodium inui San Antonio 1]